MRMGTVFGAVVLLLAACAKPEPLPPMTLSEAHVRTVQDGLRRGLKDPDSAKFGPMVAGLGKTGVASVCGWVNAKNSYGGYSGMSPFLGVMDEGGLVFEAVSIGSDRNSSDVVRIMCNGKGLALPPV